MKYLCALLAAWLVTPSTMAAVVTVDSVEGPAGHRVVVDTSEYVGYPSNPSVRQIKYLWRFNQVQKNLHLEYDVQVNATLVNCKTRQSALVASQFSHSGRVVHRVEALPHEIVFVSYPRNAIGDRIINAACSASK